MAELALGQKSTIDRFASPAARVVRALGTGASRLAPELAAAWAADRFLAPSRRRGRRIALAPGEAAFESFDGGAHRLGLWSWGERDAPRRALLVHGWEGTSAQLAPWGRALAERGFRACALDLPAHGRSSGRRTNLVEIAGVIERTAEHLGGAPEVVVAHSLGAAATVIALARGLAVRRALLVAPPAELEPFADVFASWLGLDARVRARLQERIEDAIGVEWAKISPARLARGLGAISTMIVHDELDREVPVDHGRMLAAAWPSARFVETRGLGHNRILAAPEVTGPGLDFLTTSGS
jgi:pimeloyl-ACP methyl ester carboxylesterase